jgi:hypothetical protein
MAKPRNPRTPKQKDEIVSRVKRMLPCAIDEKVTKKKEKRIVHALTEKKDEQEKMNAEILPRRKKIKELEGEIETLRAQIENGTEDREVLCDVVKDFIHHKVLVRRRDTGDVVEDRTMTEEDRQEDLLKARGKKAKAGEADTDDNDHGDVDDEGEIPPDGDGEPEVH